MTIDQMKKRKTELGYSNEMLAELSGVPLGTVQKIFAGVTRSPRYETIQKLQNVLFGAKDYEVLSLSSGSDQIAETVMQYGAYSSADISHNSIINSEYHLKSSSVHAGPVKRIGAANGKFSIPDDHFFYDDEIEAMFEDV
jgi:predicted transcriptional regulator